MVRKLEAKGAVTETRAHEIGGVTDEDIAALLARRRAINSQISTVRKAGGYVKPRPKTRKESRAETRAMVLASARAVWAEPGSYERGDIRTIAKNMGRSTGSVFSHFKTKADLWREAMGYEPPVDCAEVRELLRAASQHRIPE